MNLTTIPGLLILQYDCYYSSYCNTFFSIVNLLHVSQYFCSQVFHTVLEYFLVHIFAVLNSGTFLGRFLHKSTFSRDLIGLVTFLCVPNSLLNLTSFVGH